MYILLTVLILIAAVLLIGIVLIQKSKGGGLSSNFAGSNQIMGVRKTTDFVEKATWALAIFICVLSVLTTFCAPSDLVKGGSKIKAVPTEQKAPAFPTATSNAPAQQAPAQQVPAQGK